MPEVNLDETDFEILRELDAEGEFDAEELSERLGVSQSTIYYRMEKYQERGIVTGDVKHLDRHKLGLKLTAITEIKSTYGPESAEIGERLSRLSGVRQVYFMLGEMSFYVISHVRDHDHLQELIETMIGTEGVENSATHVVLRTFKEEPRLLKNYDENDLQKLFEN